MVYKNAGGKRKCSTKKHDLETPRQISADLHILSSMLLA